MSKSKLTASKREENRDETVTLVRLAELFHDTGLAIPTRTIYMGGVQSWDGEVGTDVLMAERVIKNLHTLENMGTGPITILMNNPGGDWYHGIAIYDSIKQSPCEITIKARGYAMSMGSIILQAATHRWMSPTASQMLHYGTDGYFHHSKTFEKYAEQSKKINAVMEGIYLDRIREKHPKFKKAQLKKLLNFDTYLTAQESIDLGLADRVG